MLIAEGIIGPWNLLQREHLRLGEICCDHGQNVRIAAGRIIEPGCVNQGYETSADNKRPRSSHLAGATLEAATNGEIRPAGLINKLCVSAENNQHGCSG